MKLKSAYLNEMEYIKDWCIAVIDFKMAMVETPKEVKNIYDSFKKNLTSNFNSKDKEIIKAVKDAYKNSQEEISFWPENKIMELNEILNLNFGERFYYDKGKELKKILKRGKIINESEFILISERVNELCQVESKSVELRNLNDLLMLFEQGKFKLK